MKCADARELLSAYLDNALDADQRSRLEEHLRECPACAAELNALRQTIALVAGLEEIEPPAEFRAELRQRLQHLAEGERGGKRIRPTLVMQMISSISLRNAVAAALVLVLTLAGGAGLGYRLAKVQPKADTSALGDATGDMVTDFTASVVPDGKGGGEPLPPVVTSGEPQMGIAAAGNATPEAQPKAVRGAEAAQPAQKIIRNGDVTLAVTDIAPAQQEVAEVATASGGYVENSSFQQVTEDSARATLQLRVPAEKLDGIVAEVKQLGQVKNSLLAAIDATATYTDAEARLKNLQLQEERLREVLGKATTVDEILRVENELGRVRTDIDVTTSMLKSLRTGVEMATLTVNLEQDPKAVAVGSDQSFWKRVGGACSNTLRAMGRALVSFAIFVGGALPILAILVVIWLLVRPKRWFRRG